MTRLDAVAALVLRAQSKNAATPVMRLVPHISPRFILGLSPGSLGDKLPDMSQSEMSVLQ